MSRVFWIDVTFVVLSIHRTRDHPHVTLALICSRGRLVRRSLCGGGYMRPGSRVSCSCFLGLLLAFFLFLFRNVLRVCIACERNVFSVWRPDRTAGALLQVGKNKGTAARHRQHCELWRLRLALFFGRAQEQQEFSVW